MLSPCHPEPVSGSVTPTRRVTEDETTHGDTQTQDEGAPGQVLDGAIINCEVILLQVGVCASRSGSLRGELGLLGRLDLGHEVANTHDE